MNRCAKVLKSIGIFICITRILHSLMWFLTDLGLKLADSDRKTAFAFVICEKFAIIL
jgi:hypothetical protein